MIQPPRFICEYPCFAGKSGGGGNRTRVGVTEEDAALQALRRRCADAWLTNRSFRDKLTEAAQEQYRLLDETAETGLYAVFDDSAVKIGISSNVFKRAEHLQNATHRSLILWAAAPATLQIEKWAHELLAAHRLRGEWFSLHPDVLLFCEVLKSTAEVSAVMVDAGTTPCSEDTLAWFGWDIDLEDGRPADQADQLAFNFECAA